jgi:cytosine/adenosine deaminase-related metal-dependent hydrolase
VTTLLGAHSIPPEFAGRADDYITAVCDEMIPRAAREGLATAVDGFCERIAFNTAQIARVFEAAQRHGLGVKLHAEQLSDSGGARLAARFDALSADHLEYASKEGVAALAKAGTVAVLLPGAYYFLKEKRMPPVDLLRRHAVKMAVATDCNPGTSPSTSLPTMINMACVLFGSRPRKRSPGRPAMPRPRWVSRIAASSSRAARRPRDLGCREPAQLAAQSAASARARRFRRPPAPMKTAPGGAVRCTEPSSAVPRRQPAGC